MIARPSLGFADPALEATYRRHIDNKRALGNFDRALVLLQALAIAAGVPRLARAGQLLSQLPMMGMLGCFALALVWLHLRSPRGGASAAATLRVPLHLVIHTAHTLQFTRVAVLPEMAACINARPAAELLALYLIGSALYPVVAAVPFRLAFPLQLALAGALLHSGPGMCKVGFASCPAAGPMHSALADGLSYVAQVLPAAPTPAVLDPFDACNAVTFFMVAVLFVGVHLAAGIVAERRARAAFAAERGHRALAVGLSKSPSSLQLSGLAVVFVVFFWRLAEAMYRTN